MSRPINYLQRSHPDTLEALTYFGLRDQAGKKEVVIQVEGTLRGQRSNANNVAGSVGGTLILTPETGQVVNANTTLKLNMDARFKGNSIQDER